MKRISLIVPIFLISLFPSFGQSVSIDQDGKMVACFGDISDWLLQFRLIYDRYPNDKGELLEYLAEDGEFVNTKDILTVSGDTCSFYIAKECVTVQCIGGARNLIKSDYMTFRYLVRSCCFDKNGKLIPSLCFLPPVTPPDIKRWFRYIVTLKPAVAHDSDVPPILLSGDSPVLIPLTLTRSGDFHYDLSCLKGVQLYYQEYGKDFNSNRLGPIHIEDAIDKDYLSVIEAYMETFLDNHQEVETVKLWELLLFNNLPNDE